MHGQVALHPFVIDQQFGFVDFGKGVSGFAQCPIEVETLRDDRVRLEIVANLDIERLTQSSGIYCRVEIAEIDRTICISCTRNDIEPHPRAPIRRILSGPAGTDRADDLAFVVAIDPKQRFKEFLILSGTGGKLRDIFVAVAQFLDG